MELEQKVKILQMVYASALADSTLRLGKEGILEKVTEEKREEQMRSGQARAAQFGIAKPEEVFEKLSEIFACANWKIEHTVEGFSAAATCCLLCTIAKKLGAQSPCNIYCLDPMEAMIKGVDAALEYDVKETLWSGSSCRVNVHKAEA